MPQPVELDEQRLRVLADAIEAAPPTADDRRLGGSRGGSSDHIRLVPFNAGGGGQSTLAQIRDVSRTGIALLVPKEMAVGQKFDLKLPRDGGSVDHVLCTVRHCRLDGFDRYIVGARFGTDWLATLGAAMKPVTRKLPPGDRPANPPPVRQVESRVVEGLE